MKDCKFCHCERSEAICVIGEKLFESEVQKGFRVSFISPPDWFYETPIRYARNDNTHFIFPKTPTIISPQKPFQLVVEQILYRHKLFLQYLNEPSFDDFL